MTKADLYSLFKSRGIPYEAMEHPAVHTMAEVDALSLPHPEWDARNLFLRDDKKRNFCLLTVREKTQVNLTAFRHDCGLRPLSFASAEELMMLMHLEPGAVTPLGLLNDEEHRVRFFLEDSFRGEKIALHPNENTATVWMNADDLMALVRSFGMEAAYVTIG